MITIDGSYGEGGGQILRSSLTLAMLTGTPCCIENIRAGRRKPGLLRQHLTAVKMAARVASAHVVGAELGSTRLVFEPNGVAAGVYHGSIGSAGSSTLVLQTVLPALARADGSSTVTVEGGTHNPFAPPFDFLRASYLPLLRRMGLGVDLTLERHGFYPRGGGRVRAEVTPGAFDRLELDSPGERRSCRAIATVADLPAHIGERELKVFEKKLGLGPGDQHLDVLPKGRGPGNVCCVELAFENVTLCFTGYGKKGLPAESVAARVVKEVRRFEKAEVAVGEHLADQLLLPMAIGEGGRFTTLRPSQHTRTHAHLIERFLETPISLEELSDDRWLVAVG